jgi:hypothetical protein
MEVISIIDKIEVVTQEFMTTHHKSNNLLLASKVPK